MSQGPLLNYADVGPRRPFPWAAVWAAGLAGVAILFLVQVNRRITHGHSGDFRHFYYAARAVLRADSVAVPPVASPGVFRAADGTVEAVVDDGTDPYTSGTGGYLYPPLIAVLYTPVARLSYPAAQRVMLVVDLALVGAGLWWASRAMLGRFDAPRRASVAAGVMLLAVLFDVDKVRNELQMFQTNAVQLALFALSLYWLDRRPRWAGVPLGAILNVKYLSLATVPWLLVRRRWATAISTLVSGVAFALLPALVVGWHRNLRYLAVAYGGLATMLGLGRGTAGPTEQANVEDITNLLSCSLTSGMARLARHLGLPLSAGLLLAGVLAAGVAGVVLVIYARRRVAPFAWPSAAGQREQPWRAVVGVEFVVVVMGTLMFSPQTNSRHLSLCVLLTAAAAALLVGGRPEVRRGVVGVAMGVMFLCFVLPPGKQFPRASDWWFGVGGPCWGLLVGTLAVLGEGLRQGRLLGDPKADTVAVPAGLPVVG